MPTLSNIQGSSLQGGVDIMQALLEGTQAGEAIRQARQRGAIDKIIAAQQGAVGATGGDTPAGGTAPQAQGSAQGGAPAQGGGGRSPGALAQAARSGTVNPNLPSLDPTNILTPQLEQQLRGQGVQGVAMIEKLGAIQDKATARANTAIDREIDGMARAARYLKELKGGDRQVALDQMRRESMGNPRILQFVDRLSKMSPDEQDIALGRAESRAISALEDRKQDREDRKAGMEERGLDIRQQEANTAAVNAAAKLRENELKRDTLNQQIKEWEAEPGRKNVDEKREMVGAVAETARDGMTSGMELRNVLDQQKRIIGEIRQLQDGNVPLGVRQDIARRLGQLDPELGAAATAFMGSPDNTNLNRLKANASKVTGAIVNQMERPSDRDLQLAYDQTTSVWNQDIETMEGILNDMTELVDERLDHYSDLNRKVVTATSSKGTEKDMDEVLLQESNDYDQMKFRDAEVAKARKILAADPTKRDAIEAYFRENNIDTRYLDYGG